MYAFFVSQQIYYKKCIYTNCVHKNCIYKKCYTFYVQKSLYKKCITAYFNLLFVMTESRDDEYRYLFAVYFVNKAVALGNAS